MFPMPLVVPKSRTVVIGGVALTRQTLGTEIDVQTRADLEAMLVGITLENTAQQLALGNPPQLLEVDGRINKPVEQATRKTVVIFGVVLARTAMRMVETELQNAIERSTSPLTGRLQNLRANWQWLYIPAGGAPRMVTSANPPTSFQRGDMLTLVPVNVPHATVANRKVANAGRLNVYTAAKTRRGSPPKSSQNIGFLGATARAVRSRTEFKDFSVRVEFTKAHAIAGELSRMQGTGVITITPRGRTR